MFFPPLEADRVNRTYLGAYPAIYAIIRFYKPCNCIDITMKFRSLDFEAVFWTVFNADAAAYTDSFVKGRFFPVLIRNFNCFMSVVVANSCECTELAA